MSWTARILLACTTTSLACGPAGETCGRATSSLGMRATVIDDAPGPIVAEVEILDGTDGYGLKLCEDDEIEINGKKPEVIDALGHAIYRVEFDQPQMEYEFEFERGDGEDARATVRPPMPVNIEAPQDDEWVARSSPFEIRWSPGPMNQLIKIDFDDEFGEECVRPWVGMDVPDDGSWILMPGAFEVGEDIPDSGECEIELTLTRVEAGEYPSNMADGSVDAVFRRHVDFLSVP